METATEDYVTLVLRIQQEWPPERLQEFALATYRENCQWYLNKRDELERENKEARTKGVSYAQRKSYSLKINALNSLFLKSKTRGMNYGKHPVNLPSLVQPEDLEYIHTMGFERFLRVALSW